MDSPKNWWKLLEEGPFWIMGLGTCNLQCIGSHLPRHYLLTRMGHLKNIILLLINQFQIRSKVHKIVIKCSQKCFFRCHLNARQGMFYNILLIPKSSFMATDFIPLLILWKPIMLLWWLWTQNKWRSVKLLMPTLTPLNMSIQSSRLYLAKKVLHFISLISIRNLFISF